MVDRLREIDFVHKTEVIVYIEALQQTTLLHGKLIHNISVIVPQLTRPAVNSPLRLNTRQSVAPSFSSACAVQVVLTDLLLVVIDSSLS